MVSPGSSACPVVRWLIARHGNTAAAALASNRGPEKTISFANRSGSQVPSYFLTDDSQLYPIHKVFFASACPERSICSSSAVQPRSTQRKMTFYDPTKSTSNPPTQTVHSERRKENIPHGVR